MLQRHFARRFIYRLGRGPTVGRYRLRSQAIRNLTLLIALLSAKMPNFQLSPLFSAILWKDRLQLIGVRTLVVHCDEWNKFTFPERKLLRISANFTCSPDNDADNTSNAEQAVGGENKDNSTQRSISTSVCYCLWVDNPLPRVSVRQPFDVCVLRCAFDRFDNRTGWGRRVNR